MDLVASVPVFNLYNDNWPVFTHSPPMPPAKLSRGPSGRLPEVSDTLLCHGAIVSGAIARGSIIGPSGFVSEAELDGALLFSGVSVGEGARLRRCVVDKNVAIPPGFRLGIDPEEDRERGFTVSPGGVVVIPKGAVLAPRD